MSICIDCKKGADECSWLFRLRPVKGWDAKKVRCADFVTYDVISCPNFEQNRKNTRRRRTNKEIAKDEKHFKNNIFASEVRGRGA